MQVKKLKQLRNDNPYMALVELQKKGLNKTFREYGKTRADALFNAKETCRIAFKKLKVGKGKKCWVWGTYTSNGRNWWPDASGPKVYKAKAKTSSSSSTIDPSVWDDLLGISEGLLGGKISIRISWRRKYKFFYFFILFRKKVRAHQEQIKFVLQLYGK